MTKRKTIKVEELVEMANNFMLNSDDALVGERSGIASFIDGVLCRANRYSGFQYLSDEDMKKSFNGKTPGIVWEMVYDDRPSSEDRPSFPDPTRRRYYLLNLKK